MRDIEFDERLSRLERNAHHGRSMGMGIRFLHDAAEIWLIDSPTQIPLPNLGDSIVLGGKEYLILWRRWRYEKIDKVYVDIGVDAAVR